MESIVEKISIAFGSKKNKWEKITKELVSKTHGLSPKRVCFADNSGIQKNKNKPTFSVKFDCAKKFFEIETGISLTYNNQYEQFYCFLDTPDKIALVEEWEKRQGKRVFLRDTLYVSFALDLNIVRDSGQHTVIGRLEHDGKVNRDPKAITKLSELVTEAINDLPFYRDADFICSIPHDASKAFDLPSEVAKLVSSNVSKANITPYFSFANKKNTVKNSSYSEKWDIWEKTGLSYQGQDDFDIKGKTIILIDDKYQSGTTLQFVAMKLQESGAAQVYGLSFVKTLRDSDNT